MFDIAPAELLVLGVVAIAVIPPKDLPRAMRVAGQWIGRMRGVARQFRSGFDEIIRESEIQEMEKKWRAENERIMREHPPSRYLDPETADAPVADAAATVADDDYREVAPVPPVASAAARDGEPPPVMTPRPVAAELPPLDRST